MASSPSTTSVTSSLSLFLHRRVITMLFLGFSAGVPILLIFSSLGLWLREAGVERSAVTYFSWAALGYSFKFVWAPLVDQLPLPLLTRWLGRRRAWMLLAQVAIAVAILVMASTNPQIGENSLTLMALGAVMLGFSSATQDIVIDAYRIESAGEELQAMMSATYIAGYRIGMLVAGAGALYLADYFGSSSAIYSYTAWQLTYSLMAAVMGVGMITTLVIREPDTSQSAVFLESTSDYLRFLLLFFLLVAGFILSYLFSADLAGALRETLSAWFANNQLAAFLVNTARLLLALTAAAAVGFILMKLSIVSYPMVDRTYLMPVKDFFERYGWSMAWILLAVIGLYRISDIVLGVISNVFYQDLGFTKSEIATVAKTFGLLMTIAGGFLGGLLASRVGVIRLLLLGGVLAAGTNLLFMVLSAVGRDITWLYIVISVDNLSAGLASAAFVAFLSSLTNISFTAIQYAIFSSLMTLFPKILGGYSGSMVDSMGYTSFFLLTALLGIPVLLLIIFLVRHLGVPDEPVEVRV